MLWLWKRFWERWVDSINRWRRNFPFGACLSLCPCLHLDLRKFKNPFTAEDCRGCLCFLVKLSLGFKPPSFILGLATDVERRDSCSSSRDSCPLVYSCVKIGSRVCVLIVSCPALPFVVGDSLLPPRSSRNVRTCGLEPKNLYFPDPLRSGNWGLWALLRSKGRSWAFVPKSVSCSVSATFVGSSGLEWIGAFAFSP